MQINLPDLCDAYPDLVRVAQPLFKHFGGRQFFAGSISTIKCHEDNSLVADAVAEPGEGRVLVVDGGGSLRCGLLGDNLALKASENGWQGIIVNGCVRDIDLLADFNLAVMALAAHPMKSIKRGVGLRDLPVEFAGVRFVPGEYCYADSNGLLVSSERLKMPE